MKVLKFGGTSVGSASRMSNVAEIIKKEKGNLIVLSAMSGTTNNLLKISDLILKKQYEGAKEELKNLRQNYIKVVNSLYQLETTKNVAVKFLESEFDLLSSLVSENFTSADEKIIVAQGEIISTNLFNLFLHEQKINSVLLSALDIVKTNENNMPDMPFIEEHILTGIKASPDADFYITQGFICRDADGNIDNLQRGGSDYTASILGAALKADEIQIWTDIDGMHNNDPRYVKNTKPVPYLNFEEAAELAYFGAKILHPTCIKPAQQANIPVRLLNTMQPDAFGTIITNHIETQQIKAVAAKDNITAIKIKSSNMLLAYGFLTKIFEIFEKYKTPIDMITTSEVGVSVTIDDDTNLGNIINELKELGNVDIETNMVIICVVGDMDWANIGFQSKAMNAFKEIPVRMVSYGGSNFNISFLVNAKYKQKAINELSKELFA